MLDPSNPEKLKAATADLLRAFLPAMVVVGCLVWLSQYAWPAVAYFAIAVVIARLVRPYSNPWAKAALGILRPSIVGFAILTLLLLYINVYVDGLGNPSPDVQVRKIEFVLIDLSAAIQPFAAIGALLFSSVLILLIVAARHMPYWKPVSRFMWVKKHFGRLSAALAVVASFSFFLDDHVAGMLARRSEDHVVAIYRHSRAREMSHLARYVSLRALAIALAYSPGPPPPFGDLLTAFGGDRGGNGGGSDSRPSPERLELARYVAYRRAGGMALSDAVDLNEMQGDDLNAPQADPGMPDIPLPSSTYVNEPVAKNVSAPQLETQYAGERTAAALAAQEEQQAFREIVTIACGSASEHLQALSDAVVNSILHSESGFVGDKLRAYLDNVADKSVEKATQAIVDNEAVRLEHAFELHANENARASIAAAAHELAIDGAGKFIALANRLVDNRFGLPDIVRSRSVDIAALKEVVRKASGLAKTFGPCLQANGTSQPGRTTDSRGTLPSELDLLRDLNVQLSILEKKTRVVESNQIVERAAVSEGARRICGL
jgi:hypothetical protein